MKFTIWRMGRVTMTLMMVGCLAWCLSGSDPLATGSALADGSRSSAGGPQFTLEFGTVSAGGGPLDNGGFAVISKGPVGTMTSAEFTIEVGAVRLLAGSGPACGDCPTDVDGSGDTGAFDLANLLGAWGPCAAGEPCECLDADANGSIDAFDLATLLGAWGPCL